MAEIERVTLGLEIVKALAAVAVPLVIAFVGNQYSSAMKDSENRVRYVELAVSTLKSDPTPESKALREWAIELLATQSPIGLSDAAKKELSLRPIPLNATASGAAHSGGSAVLAKKATAPE